MVLANLRNCSPSLCSFITLITYLYFHTCACLALAWPASPWSHPHPTWCVDLSTPPIPRVCCALFSLAENARNVLPDWYNDVCSQARNLCAPYEPTGALTLVATAITWNAYPGHITNIAAVLANGDPPQYLARPTWVLPAAHAANATAAAVSLYREELARNHAYVAATSAVVQALLTSIGPDNKTFLEAQFDPDPLYSLTPRQIVDAMMTEHGTTSADDLKKLRAPLHEPLKALADLERHMNAFLLASKKLTKSGQGKKPYEYFEAFLETLKGFLVVGLSMPTFYAQYPTMDTQNLAGLFPYLKAQYPYMLAQSVASPFSGAVIPPSTQKPKNKNKNKGRRGKGSSSSTADGRPPKWGPNGPKQRAGSPPNFSGDIFGGAACGNYIQPRRRLRGNPAPHPHLIPSQTQCCME